MDRGRLAPWESLPGNLSALTAVLIFTESKKTAEGHAAQSTMVVRLPVCQSTNYCTLALGKKKKLLAAFTKETPLTILLKSWAIGPDRKRTHLYGSFCTGIEAAPSFQAQLTCPYYRLGCRRANSPRLNRAPVCLVDPSNKPRTLGGMQHYYDLVYLHVVPSLHLNAALPLHRDQGC